jgi:thymidylate kinase
MAKINLLNYFLVKESLVDMNFRENLSCAKQGNQIDQAISDMYLARKMIYQACKGVADMDGLKSTLERLEGNIPQIGLIFDHDEFQNAWRLTIQELRQKFEIRRIPK